MILSAQVPIDHPIYGSTFFKVALLTFPSCLHYNKPSIPPAPPPPPPPPKKTWPALGGCSHGQASQAGKELGAFVFCLFLLVLLGVYIFVFRYLLIPIHVHICVCVFVFLFGGGFGWGWISAASCVHSTRHQPCRLQASMSPCLSKAKTKSLLFQNIKISKE